MANDTPTPDATTPDTTTAAPAAGPGWLPVTHQLVRRHDGSLISKHCCSSCGMQALEDLTLAQIIGPNPPGPLRDVWADLVDVASGQAVAWTLGLTPLNGEPTDVHSWP